MINKINKERRRSMNAKAVPSFDGDSKAFRDWIEALKNMQ
jgi:hypothetical protein